MEQKRKRHKLRGERQLQEKTTRILNPMKQNLEMLRTRMLMTLKLMLLMEQQVSEKRDIECRS